jgi:MFS family permease
MSSEGPQSPGTLAPEPASSSGLTVTGRYLIIITAFFGWFFGGTHMAINGLAMRSAALNLLIISEGSDLTEDDRSTIAAFRKGLDSDGDGVIQTATFPRLQPAPGEEAGKLDLAAVGLKKNPDAVKVLGVAGDQDGVISEAELKRYVIDDRLGARAGKWFGFYVCAFLFGAALGGLVFGRIGDRFGRVKGMAAAITCYSGMSLISYFAQSPTQLWIARFITCMGVGGMWPNGVALMSEAWAGVSRPMLAGVIGTAANVGIFLTYLVGRQVGVDYDSWRWVLLMGGSPIVLAVFVIALVPESPKWIADRKLLESMRIEGEPSTPGAVGSSTWEVFKPGLLGVTLVGILLATVPLMGGWGATNWSQGWADKVGAEIGNPNLKADIGMARSLTGIIGSFLGGIIASGVGRKKTYFLTSLLCLACAEYVYFFHTPDQWQFLAGFAVLGFFSGIFFGWLPLFLPELFVTRIRSTGAGVCFNFGRIITAVTVFAGAFLIQEFNEDYALLGRIMSLIYLLGAIGICLMPSGVGGTIED